MNFNGSENPATLQDIIAVEYKIGLNLPVDLKSQYLQANGGAPEPYVYEDDGLDTVVAAFLPIKSSGGKRTAADTYQNLVLSKKIVPRSYFPFAVDGGGDYFFVDCSSSDGQVYFFRSDSYGDDAPLLKLGVTIGEFWDRLTEE